MCLCVYFATNGFINSPPIFPCVRRFSESICNDEIVCRRVVSGVRGHHDRGPVPERSRPGPAESGAVRAACDPRACARQQGVRLRHCTCNAYRVRLTRPSILSVRVHLDTSSRGAIRHCRASRRTGWAPATTAVSAAWTPCRWRRATRTNGLSSDWSTARYVIASHGRTHRARDMLGDWQFRARAHARLSQRTRTYRSLTDGDIVACAQFSFPHGRVICVTVRDGFQLHNTFSHGST